MQKLTPERPQCTFNESFQMKTQLEWIQHKRQFKKKRSDFQIHQIDEAALNQHGNALDVVLKGNSRLLGSVQMDLAQAATTKKKSTFKLGINDCAQDPKAYLSVSVSSEVLSGMMIRSVSDK